MALLEAELLELREALSGDDAADIVRLALVASFPSIALVLVRWLN